MTNYIKYTLTSSGGTLNTSASSGNYSPLLIETSGVVSLAASFSIVDTIQIINQPVKIRWNATVLLNTYSVTIGGIGISQDQINQPGTFELLYDGSSYSLQYFPDFTYKPQENYGVTTITVPLGGGTLTINPGTDKKTYVLQGTTTLISNYTVVGNTVGVTDGSAVRVVLAGGITKGANTVTIFGQSISSYDCLIGGAEVYAEFNATTSSYVATYVNRDIPLDKLLTTGFVSGDNGKLVMYDFATNKFVKDFLSSANLPSTFKGINITQTYITSAQILTLNTTPVTILPASGSSTVVEVPLMFVVRYKYGTTAYTSNLDCRFENTGVTVTDTLADKIGMLGFGASGIDIVVLDNFNATGPAILLQANSTVRILASAGNPSGGDGDVIIYVISTTLDI
jgi:hypothetical protein